MAARHSLPITERDPLPATASRPSAGAVHGPGPEGDRLARGLGWASAGLGIPPLVAPGWFGREIGVGDAAGQRAAVTFVGVRELAAAAGLLRRASPAWLWARVAGDLMDLVLLGRALKNHGQQGRRRTAVATAAVVGITGIDVYAAATRSCRATEMELTAVTTIVSSAGEAYDRWRQLESLPGPCKAGERGAEVTEDVPGERIAWRSVGRGAVTSEGNVRFMPAPGARGIEIHVTLRYSMPGGNLGEAAARYFGKDPHQQLDDHLRRFKQIVETGEVVRSDGVPGGKRARREFPQHPARPLSPRELKEERS